MTNNTINTLTYRGAKKIIINDVQTELIKIQNNFESFNSNLTRFCEMTLYKKIYKVRNKKHMVTINAYRDEEVQETYEFDIQKYTDSLNNLKISSSFDINNFKLDGYMVSIKTTKLS